MVVVQLQVQELSSCSLIPLTRFAGYESLPDSGSGAGPQRSVEGWVVFVTGIYEETQVLYLSIVHEIVFTGIFYKFFKLCPLNTSSTLHADVDIFFPTTSSFMCFFRIILSSG